MLQKFYKHLEIHPTDLIKEMEDIKKFEKIIVLKLGYKLTFKFCN